MTIPWWGYVVLAGISWGVYVPIIFYGGSELGGRQNARLMAILCVGVAYFVLAVMFPLILFLSGQLEWPSFKTNGLVFAGLAGVAGAVGAICVVYASGAAVTQAKAEGAVTPSELAKYRIYIAPLIFGLAPLINAVVASVWHPLPGHPAHFDPKLPDWRFLTGIVFIGLGVALVLYAKEAREVSGPVTPKPVDAGVPAGTGA